MNEKAYEDYLNNFCEADYPHSVETWFRLEWGIPEKEVQSYIDREEREKKEESDRKESECSIHITGRELANLLLSLDNPDLPVCTNWYNGGYLEEISKVQTIKVGTRGLCSRLHDKYNKFLTSVDVIYIF